MKITKLVLQSKNKERISVFIDGEFWQGITDRTQEEFWLRVGKEVTEEDLEAIKRFDINQLAYVKVLDIINRADRTTKEIRTKLKQKDFDDESIEYAINRALSYNIINDYERARTYVELNKNTKSFGKIKNKLYEIGMNSEQINSLKEEFYDADDEVNLAYNALVKKMVSYSRITDKYKRKQKMNSFLLSRGYSYDVVSQALNKFTDENEEDYVDEEI